MVSPVIVFCKSLLLLSVIGAVLSEHQKRDVHRIIIQERVPARSPKKGHDRSKSPQHHGSEESESSSYEDNGSFSKENSYEEVLRSHKSHKSPNKKRPTPRNHRHHKNLKLAESQKHYRKSTPQTDWIPLNSDQVMKQHSHRTQDKRNKRKDAKQRKQNNRQTTTPNPQLHFEGSTLYPAISLLDGNRLSLVGAMEVPQLDFSLMKDHDRVKNYGSSYGGPQADSSGNVYHFLWPDDESEGSSEEMRPKKRNRNRARFTK